MTDLNSAFHKPKKSMRDMCKAYKNKEQTVKLAQQNITIIFLQT
jgi:hypothetical protein